MGGRRFRDGWAAQDAASSRGPSSRGATGSARPYAARGLSRGTVPPRHRDDLADAGASHLAPAGGSPRSAVPAAHPSAWHGAPRRLRPGADTRSVHRTRRAADRKRAGLSHSLARRALADGRSELPFRLRLLRLSAGSVVLGRARAESGAQRERLSPSDRFPSRLRPAAQERRLPPVLAP